MKRIVVKVITIVNVILNIIMGLGWIMNFMQYASIGAYVYSDDINRLPLMVWGFAMYNIAHYYIIKRIKEF